MSGIVGHTLYAVLGAKAASHRHLGLAAIATRNFPSFLAGAYLGSDIQVMPEAVCVDTGREVGFGTVPLGKSPITGGAVRPWTLKHGGREYRPMEIHERFYGRSHVVFGWPRAERANAVPWERLDEYCAAVLEDTLEFHGPSERAIAYVLGWMVHVVSDSLIKSQRAGLELHLLDGKYTPRNRPIQDLVSFHEIGIKEFKLNWPALLADLAATPVEPVQSHYMRVGEKRGRLAAAFPELWAPAEAPLLAAVLAENRRWCGPHARDELKAMELVSGPDGRPDCNPELRRSVGLSYDQMVELAEKAHYRRALGYIGDVIADLMEAIGRRSPRLARLGGEHGPGWETWMKRW
ncbi:hypothetical protein [Horticoccus sp. 23ND18S-11]|uniref:hypothetical protein n=1 Tax=Horticoccus sp. 23ND18S-11 TaxID=3391832 RepID=UPI0039C9D16A